MLAGRCRRLASRVKFCFQHQPNRRTRCQADSLNFRPDRSSVLMFGVVLPQPAARPRPSLRIDRTRSILKNSLWSEAGGTRTRDQRITKP